jgi:CheY-like chemotaxis protein
MSVLADYRESRPHYWRTLRLSAPAEVPGRPDDEASPGEESMMLPTLETTTTTIQPPLRILVADDNEMLGAAVQGLLRSLGHSVDVVTNGREAIESAARGDFDVVFLDVQMPEMDGFAVAHSLRQKHRGGLRPRIIGLSAERPERKSYVAAGMDDFLQKPVRLAELDLALSYQVAS